MIGVFFDRLAGRPMILLLVTIVLAAVVGLATTWVGHTSHRPDPPIDICMSGCSVPD